MPYHTGWHKGTNALFLRIWRWTKKNVASGYYCRWGPVLPRKNVPLLPERYSFRISRGRNQR